MCYIAKTLTAAFVIVLLGCQTKDPEPNQASSPKLPQESPVVVSPDQAKPKLTANQQWLQECCGTTSLGGITVAHALYDASVFGGSNFDNWDSAEHKCMMLPKAHSWLVSMIAGLDSSKLDRQLYVDVVIPSKKFVFEKYMFFPQKFRELGSEQEKQSACLDAQSKLSAERIAYGTDTFESMLKEFYDCLSGATADVPGRIGTLPEGIIPDDYPVFDPSHPDSKGDRVL